MKTLHCECDRFERVVRWIARGLSVLAVGMLVLFAVGEGPPPNPFRAPTPVAIELFGMLGIAVGLAVAWKYEAVGGGLAVASFLTFQAVELIENGRPALNGAFILLGLPAVLFLLAAGRGQLRRYLMSRAMRVA